MIDLEQEIKKAFEESPVTLSRTTDTVMKMAQAVIRKHAPRAFDLPLSHTLEITVDSLTVQVSVNMLKLQLGLAR